MWKLDQGPAGRVDLLFAACLPRNAWRDASSQLSEANPGLLDVEFRSWTDPEHQRMKVSTDRHATYLMH